MMIVDMRGIIVALGLVAASLAGSTPARAMTSQPVEKTCPYDGTKFQFEKLMSGTVVDTALDLMPLGFIMSPTPLAVCPTNGFVFLKDDYSDEELERLRPFILSQEYQGLKDETPYFRAARILEHTGAQHSDVSRLLLGASWEAGWSDIRASYVDKLAASSLPQQPKTSSEKERANVLWSEALREGTSSERYTRYAAELLARLPVDVQDAQNEELRTNFKLLLGELLRRLKRFEEAQRYFGAIATEFADGSTTAKIIAFQLQLIAKQDAGMHRATDIFPRPPPRRGGGDMPPKTKP